MIKSQRQSIRRIRIVPYKKIHDTFRNINNTSLTFGVHKEDNSEHGLRDSIQKKPLHKSLYGDSSKIGNAELLAKTERGFITDININGKLTHLEVAPRPVLKPMLKIGLHKGSFKTNIKQGLKQELSFNSINGLENAFNRISIGLSTENILNFLKNRGGKYWSKAAKHNSPYTAAVKFLESLGETDLYNVYNDKKGTINKISEWENIGFYKKADMPLQDSLDLIKSIKAKVERK